MFTEHQPRALYRQFIHVSSHLILPIIPGGRDYNYSLLTDLETEARHRAKTPPGPAVSKGALIFGLQQSGPHLWVGVLPLKLKQGSIAPIPDPLGHTGHL